MTSQERLLSQELATNPISIGRISLTIGETMQNRTHRNLLFNSRATTGTDSTLNTDGGEMLESDNQKSVENLRGSALTIKDIALHVDASVNDQNLMLDKMDKRFDSTKGLVSTTLSSLQDMVADRSSLKICTVITAFFLMLCLVYLWRKYM